MKIRLRRIRKLAGGLCPLLALCLIVALAVPAVADVPPSLPRDHSFWGSVTIGETPAEPGTVVTATIAGVDDEWTSTVVDIEGYDGYYGLNDPPDYPDNLLEVPADDPATPGIKEGGVEGDTVEFRVLGELAGEAPFVPDGTTRLDLQVTITYTLTVNIVGNGSVTKNPDQATYTSGDVVQLTAVPDTGWSFDGWSGDLTGTTSPDSITMDGNKTVTATFAPIPYTLTVDIIGNGSVTKNPDQATYTYGDVVQLTAVPDTGWSFEGWSDDLTGTTNPDSITMDGNKTVTATFALIGLPCELTVNANPPEGGEVTGAGTYTCGADAPIVATPNSCYEFVNWSGAGITDPNLASTTVLVDENKTVTANFALLEYNLTVASTDGGSVTDPGEGVFTYDCGVVVDLVAEAEPDYHFVNWTGDVGTVANVNVATTTITINDNYGISANFEPVEPKTLTVNSTDGGSVTSPGEDTFTYLGGTVVPLVADPDPCANFIGWTGDAAAVAAVDNVTAASTFITMNGDYTITANFVPPEVLKTVTLNDGWNTFSTPLTLNQCTNTWSKLVEENNLTGLYMIYRFDVSTGYWALITGGDPVRPLEGYYVNMTTEGETVSIIPDREPPLIPPSAELSNGLNFIGTPSLEDLDAVTALLDIYEAAGGYSKVINPDENDPWTSNIYSRDIPPVPIMVACKAYWVVMPNPGAVLVGVLPPPL